MIAPYTLLMLTHIHIRDFAIVDELELELGDGMCALTGETGAGKSILVDALGLALGDRGDAQVIRHGAERTEIAAEFDVSRLPEAHTWLQEQSLDGDEHQCLLRRVLTREGRSRGYINGRSVPMQSLRELGNRLVDIHGQHEHQSLLRRPVQRQLLDDYGASTEEAAALETTYRQWKAKTAELEALREAAADRTARSELLRFQVRELEELDLSREELADIEAEHQRLAHAGELLENCQNALTELYEGDDDTVHQRLSRLQNNLEPMVAIDASLGTITELINQAVIQTEEAADELRRRTQDMDMDPQRLQWLEERLGTIHDLSRKHRVAAAELPALQEQLQRELAELDHADEHLGTLQDEIDALRHAYDQQAQALGRKRRKAATALNKRVTEIIQQLGMEGARFEVAVDAKDPAEPSPTGLESIEFRVATNPGQPPQALTRIASGGELSRLSLGIQVVLANTTRIPTLIYDEVDTGIGGAVAEVVGTRLRALGEVRQVLCVTHLPQVAAQAHRHLQIRKHTEDKTTRTAIRTLTDEERIDEIARMLGGVEITRQTRAHAREMIGKAAAPRAGGKKTQRSARA